MSQEQWSRLLTSQRPVTFENSTGILELHACCLVSEDAGPSAVYCSVPGHPTLALGRVKGAEPHCHIVARFEEEDVTFSCEGSDVLLLGVLHPEVESADERPAKAARKESSAEGATAKAVPAAAPVAAAAAAGAASAGAAAAAKPAAEAAKAAPAATPTKEAPSSAAPAKASPKAAAKAEPEQLSKSAKKRMRQEAAKAAAKAAAGPAASPAGASSAATAASKPAEAPKPATAPAQQAQDVKPGQPLARRKLPSGLQYSVLKNSGSPVQATSGKIVQVKYEGRLATSGARFDKGVIKFRLGMGEVIRGWDEGVKGMLKGERRRLLVPAHLGYGHQGAPPAIPPNADLVFEVELVGCM